MKPTHLRSAENSFLRYIVREYCVKGKVLNLGEVQINDDREKRNKEGRTRMYQDYFDEGVEYYTLDKRPKQGTYRHYELDILDAGCIGQKFNFIMCLNFMEHLEHPFESAEMIKWLMADKGLLYVAVPFMYPYHADKDTEDYWRFTPEAVKVLFKGLVLHEFKKVIHKFGSESFDIGYLFLLGKQ